MRTVMALLAALLMSMSIPTSSYGQDEPARSVGAALDFQGAALETVISALAELGSLNVVFGSLPDRLVTLRVGESPDREQVVDLLRAVSESNGLDLVVRQDLVVITVRGEPPEAAIEPLDDESQRVFVYQLRHTRAPALAQTLRSLFGGGRSGAGADLGANVAEEQGGDLFALGVEMVQGPELTLPGELSADLQIIADDATNSILVRSSAADWAVLEPSIQALDQRPLQVLIELLIVEVRRDANEQTGVSFETTDPIDIAGFGTVDGALRAATGGDVSISARDLGGLDLGVALSLLSTSGEVRILSRPVILAQNNQESSILVGSERPFVQVFRSLPTEGAVRDQIVQYREVGTSLSITPTIYPDGYVNLSVAQEVSSATSEVQFGAPVISTRQAQAQLFARTGGTIVMGGLIDEQVVRSKSGIPLLKDVPLLGYLFGTTRNRRVQSELFLFLTAHLVENDRDVERLLTTIQDRLEMIPDVPPALLQRQEGGAGIQLPEVRPLVGDQRRERGLVP